jgi:hypothetical protein
MAPVARKAKTGGLQQANAPVEARSSASLWIRLRYTVNTFIQHLRPHAIPLVIVLAAVVVGQIAVFIQTPIANFFPDTPSYVSAAWNISQSPRGLIQALRPPGYPLFIYLVLALQGAPRYSQLGNCWHPAMQGICTQQLNSVVFAQGIVAVIAALECYVLVWRLSHRRSAACLATTLIALNIYFGSWERMVLSEFLSYWATLTVFLVFERMVRYPSVWRASLFAVMCVVAIMIRPFNLYLPLVLVPLLGVWYLWTHQLRIQMTRLLSTIVVISVCLVGYMALNARHDGYFSISWEANVTLFGKIMEYHMEYYPVPAQYQALQTKLDAWVTNRDYVDPWIFSDDTKLYYENTGFQLAGSYARYVIIHHPLTFLQHSVPDVLREWMNTGQLYSQYGVTATGAAPPTEPSWADVVGFTAYPELVGTVSGSYNPGWITVLLALSTLENYGYLLVPLFLLLAGLRLQARRSNGDMFVMLCMALAAIAAVFVGAIGNYSEFYRTRFPIDWAVIALLAIWLVEMFVAVARQPLPQQNVYGSRDASTGADTTRHDWPTESPDPGTVATLPLPAQRRGPQRRHPSSVGTGSISAPSLRLPPASSDLPEISIVLPCLNEEDAIGGCIDTLRYIIWEQRLSAEIIVVDNASTDRSNEIARAHGARVVYQAERGYGNAYLKGFAEARGKYIVMADADNTYDLTEVNEFVEPLRRGYDLVIGNRFAGRMAKGAMTFSHRYIGNPILSGILRLFFHTTVRDAHCGMRAFTRAAYGRMRLHTGGMEFASEMVINAAKAGLKIAERPVSYSPRIGESKLNTLGDGWRHLRFMLLYSPTHLFLIPGLLLLLVGLLVEAVLIPGPIRISRVTFDVHTMMLGSVMALLGVQIILLGLFARFFSLTEELDGEQDRVLQLLTRAITLERGLFAGAAFFAMGVASYAYVLISWVASGMGRLALIRPTVVGSTLLAIGVEVIFGSFFLSYLQFRKSLHNPHAPLNDAASIHSVERVTSDLTPS